MTSAPDILLVNARTNSGIDNIDTYTRGLARALTAAGRPAGVLTWDRAVGDFLFTGAEGGAMFAGEGAVRMMQAANAVMFQYNPFAWGRWGVAPMLVGLIAALRTQRTRGLLCAMEHEQFVPRGSWRLNAMRLWQQGQLATIRLGMDRVFVSTEAWVSEARPWHPAARLLPTRADFPDVMDQREEARAALGVPDGTVLIASISGGQADLGHDLLLAGLAAASRVGPVAFLHLGAAAGRLGGLSDDILTYTPGMLSSPTLATLLSGSDLYLAPIDDGVSTRRTSVAAALQMGVPIVGTDGPSTGALLRGRRGLALAPAGKAQAFGETVTEVLSDPAGLTARGSDARWLYDQLFSWPSLAGRILAEL